MNIADLPIKLEALNNDPTIQRRVRFADAIVQIEVGEDRWAVALRDGKLSIASDGEDADVTITISTEAWQAFQQPVPPPGCHDIYAMAETGRATVKGDFLALFRYSYVLKDIVQQLATGRMFG